jgi:predicted DNA-binding transcriptional regulator YafY
MVTDEDRKAAADFMCAPSTDSDLEVLAELLARHRIAAEQRGYQQGMEEAAGALEADAKLCDCHARSVEECACGAWDGWKTITADRAVQIVRAKAKEKNDG